MYCYVIVNLFEEFVSHVQKNFAIDINANTINHIHGAAIKRHKMRGAGA